MLISGCAHNGILNILDKYQELYGRFPARVISGFHMMKKTPYTEEEAATDTCQCQENWQVMIRSFIPDIVRERKPSL